jgi:hypothetical protein
LERAVKSVVLKEHQVCQLGKTHSDEFPKVCAKNSWDLDGEKVFRNRADPVLSANLSCSSLHRISTLIEQLAEHLHTILQLSPCNSSPIAMNGFQVGEALLTLSEHFESELRIHPLGCRHTQVHDREHRSRCRATHTSSASS